MERDRETITDTPHMTNVVHLTERAPAPRGLPKLVETLRKQAHDVLAILVERLFNNLDDALFEMADRAVTNSDQNLYFDAMRALRLEREPLTERFGTEFDRGFGVLNGPSESATEQEVDFDTLGLIDTEQMEIRVALAGVVSKANSLHALSVSQLTRRLATVFPAVEMTVQNNPFGPHAICEAFGRASEPLDVDIRIRIILLKLFERFVMERMGDFYASANKQLADAGVLRKASDFRRHGRSRAGARQTATGPAAGAGATPGRASPAAMSPALDPPTAAEQAEFAALAELLRGASGSVRGSVPPQPASSDSHPAITTSLLLERLHQAQLGMLGQTSVPDDAPARFEVPALLGSTARLGQSDADVVNLVGMLFDYILNDRNLAIPMKALLARLQIPILKVALVDRTFFTRSRHPARQLLNELSSAGIGWSSAAELKRDGMYARIESIVARVLSDYDADLSLFSELVTELREFVAAEKQRASVVEQRTRDAEAGRARTRAARRDVNVLLSRKCSGLPLPPELERFVSDRWARVLTFVHLREGVESERWFSAVQALDELLAAAMPAESDYEREKRGRQAPLLLRLLREGLGWIGADGAEIDDELQRLRELLDAANRGAPPPAVPVAPRAVAPAPLEGDDDPGSAPQASARALERIDRLQPGQWVEFRDPDKPALRARLMTTLENEKRHVFVNRRGMKVAERTRAELAAALDAEQLVIVDDAEVFERALQAVIGDLRRAT